MRSQEVWTLLLLGEIALVHGDLDSASDFARSSSMLAGAPDTPFEEFAFGEIQHRIAVARGVRVSERRIARLDALAQRLRAFATESSVGAWLSERRIATV